MDGIKGERKVNEGCLDCDCVVRCKMSPRQFVLDYNVIVIFLLWNIIIISLGYM
jgi:hypothetical protein